MKTSIVYRSENKKQGERKHGQQTIERPGQDLHRGKNSRIQNLEVKPMKNMKKYLMILCTALLMLALTACGKMEVDMDPYFSVSFNGRNGNATAYVQFDYAEFEHGIMSQWKDGDKNMEKLAELTALETTFQLSPESAEGLSNGDTITVNLTCNEEKAKELGYSFKNMQKTFTVEGLEDATPLDPFDESVFGPDKTVDVEIDGTSPYISVYINNHAQDVYGIVRYKVDKDYKLSNGETVTITASIDPKWEDEYALTRTETTLTIEGLNSYVTDVSMLNHTSVQTLQEQAKEFLDKKMFYGIDLHTTDPEQPKRSVGSSRECTHSDLAFMGSGYVAGVEEGFDTSYYLLVPFQMSFENNVYYTPDGSVTLSFPDACGYFVIKSIRVDPEGNLVPGYGSVNKIEMFENQEVMDSYILDQYGELTPADFN